MSVNQSPIGRLKALAAGVSQNSRYCCSGVFPMYFFNTRRVQWRRAVRGANNRAAVAERDGTGIGLYRPAHGGAGERVGGRLLGCSERLLLLHVLARLKRCVRGSPHRAIETPHARTHIHAYTVKTTRRGGRKSVPAAYAARRSVSMDAAVPSRPYSAWPDRPAAGGL